MGRVATDRWLLFLLLLQTIFGSLWYTSAVVQVATNCHEQIAKVVLAASCGCLLLVAWTQNAHSMGLSGVAGALILDDLVISWFVLRSSMRITEDKMGAFLRSLIDIPLYGRGSCLANNGPNAG